LHAQPVGHQPLPVPLVKRFIKAEMCFDGFALFFGNGAGNTGALSGLRGPDTLHLHNHLFDRSTGNKLNQRKT
jgi:hypothetical protein